ncbi:MAG: hypothetical protein ACYTBW_03265 [Planctomycetota bacterium]
METTSKQELMQLLNEGKIDQSEHEQLLSAMLPKSQSNDSIKKSKMSCKKNKVLAILNTTAFLCFLIALIMAVISRNHFQFMIMVVCTFLGGVNALRYWIRIWTFD